MITQAILNAFAYLLSSLISVLPAVSGLSLSTYVSNALASHGGHTVFDYFGYANNYFPLDQLVTAMTLLMTLFAITWGFRLLIWLLRLVHVAGGSDG